MPQPELHPELASQPEPEPVQELSSIQAPSTPEPASEREKDEREKDDSSVGSLTAEEDQGPCRGNRERHAPKRFGGSSNKPVKKKGARGGGQGQGGRSKGK